MQARLRLKLGKKVLSENTTLKEQYEHYEVEVGDIRLLLEKPGFEELIGGNELDVILQLTPSGTIDPKFVIVNPKNPEDAKKKIEEREKADSEARIKERQVEFDETQKKIKAAEGEGFKLFEVEQESRRKEGKPPLEYGQLDESNDPLRKEAVNEAAKTSFKGGTWAEYDTWKGSSRKRLGLDAPTEGGEKTGNAADAPDKKPGEQSRETSTTNRQSAAARLKAKLKK